MSYLTTAEEIGLEKGLQQGTEKLFAHLLQSKFGYLPKSYEERIRLADTAKLMHWADLLLKANALEDIFN